MTDAASLLNDNGIDLPWLAARLDDAAAAPGGRLQAMTPTIIGTGQVGENVRCTLEWDGPGPATVVIKLPSSNAHSRETAAATRSYIREVGFYRDVQDQVAIPTPQAYHVSEDRAANSFVLVMADVAPAEVGDQLAGCSLERAHAAMDAIAGLHGPTWGRAELCDLDWVDGPDQAENELRVAAFSALSDGFLDAYRRRLTADEIDLVHWLRQSLGRLLDAREPTSLAHGDFRLDNVLFGTGPDVAAVTTVDWQTVAYGHGPSDVAYFLSGAFDAEPLRLQQDALLNRYRRAMAANGVELSPTDVADGYRLGAASGFVMAVMASQLVGRTPRGDDMFVAMARGSAQLVAAVDLPGALT